MQVGGGRRFRCPPAGPDRPPSSPRLRARSPVLQFLRDAAPAGPLPAAHRPHPVLPLLSPTRPWCPLPRPSAGRPPLTHTPAPRGQDAQPDRCTDLSAQQDLSAQHGLQWSPAPRALMVLTRPPDSGRLGTLPPQKRYFFILTVCLTFIIIIVIVTHKQASAVSKYSLASSWIRGISSQKLHLCCGRQHLSICSSGRPTGEKGAEPMWAGRPEGAERRRAS